MSPSSATGFKTPIDMLGFFGWLASIKQGILESVKVKCIFLGYWNGYLRKGRKTKPKRQNRTRNGKAWKRQSQDKAQL
ncbi:hypothetical protein Tco_0620200 [Tanacetum coccineum]